MMKRAIREQSRRRRLRAPLPNRTHVSDLPPTEAKHASHLPPRREELPPRPAARRASVLQALAYFLRQRRAEHEDE